jgi:hypothetical protein
VERVEVGSWGWELEVGSGGGGWRWGMEVRVVCTLVFGSLFFDNALQSLQVSETLE